MSIALCSRGCWRMSAITVGYAVVVAVHGSDCLRGSPFHPNRRWVGCRSHGRSLDIPPSGRGVSRFRAFGTRFGGGREQVTVLVDQERDAVGGDVLRDYDRPLPLGVVGFGDLTGGDVVHPDRSLLTQVEEDTPECGDGGLRADREGPQALMVRVIGVQSGLVTDDERVGDG